MYDLLHIPKIIMPKGVGVEQIAIPISKECKSLIELCIKDGKLCVRDGEIIVRDMNVPLSETCIGYLKGKRYLLYKAILDTTTVMTSERRSA